MCKSSPYTVGLININWFYISWCNSFHCFRFSNCCYILSKKLINFVCVLEYWNTSTYCTPYPMSNEENSKYKKKNLISNLQTTDQNCHCFQWTLLLLTCFDVILLESKIHLQWLVYFDHIKILISISLQFHCFVGCVIYGNVVLPHVLSYYTIEFCHRLFSSKGLQFSVTANKK